MLGDSITINLGGSGGTARTLNKINQDKYSAEYLERTATDQLRMYVRHTTEKSKDGAKPLDRHNVEFTQTIFATADDPEIVRNYYFVFRHQVDDVEADAIDVAEGLIEWQDATNLGKLYGWQS